MAKNSNRNLSIDECLEILNARWKSPTAKRQIEVVDGGHGHFFVEMKSLRRNTKDVRSDTELKQRKD